MRRELSVWLYRNEVVIVIKRYLNLSQTEVNNLEVTNGDF